MVGKQEITIGRNPQCDLRLGDNCIYASGVHATMYMENGNLMYRDVSRNGTVINGTKIVQNVFPLQFGDHILIAGQYQLRWDIITRYFPQYQQGYAPQNAMQQPAPAPDNMGTTAVSAEDNIFNEANRPDLGWNWGAFMLYPLWGFWNGCWWAILVAFFFGWLGILPNILFGIMGSKWAWNAKAWKSARDFNEMQEAWKPWGIAVFVFNIIILCMVWFFYSALIISLFSTL